MDCTFDAEIYCSQRGMNLHGATGSLLEGCTAICRYNAGTLFSPRWEFREFEIVPGFLGS